MNRGFVGICTRSTLWIFYWCVQTTWDRNGKVLYIYTIKLRTRITQFFFFSLFITFSFRFALQQKWCSATCDRNSVNTFKHWHTFLLFFFRVSFCWTSILCAFLCFSFLQTHSLNPILSMFCFRLRSLVLYSFVVVVVRKMYAFYTWLSLFCLNIQHKIGTITLTS